MMKLKKQLSLATSALLTAGISLSAAENTPKSSGKAEKGAPQVVSPMKSSAPKDPQAIKQKIQSLESEFMQVVEKIQSVEQQALEEEKVAEAREQYETLLENKILEENPELEETMARRDEYKGYLEKAQAGESLPEGMEIRDVYSEYKSLEQQVVPVQRKVMQDEEVRQVQQKYQQTLVAEMKEIDPDIMELVDRQNKLRQRYRQLMQQMQGMSG